MSEQYTEIDQDALEHGSLLPAVVSDKCTPPAVAEKVAAPMTSQQCRVVEVTEALSPAYSKASTLELTDAEISELMAPFPDSAVELRPHDGLCYIPHILISDRLNRVFKPGKWALIRRREWMESNTMYAEYVMLIRGCYVGESIGGHPYQPNNPKVNYSDTLESTAAEALRRIAGKRLSCGSQVWNPDYCRKWTAQYAVQVGGKWTRKSAEQAAAPAPRPAHPAPAPAPKPAPVAESPAAKKARFLEACKSAGGGAESYAVDLFVEMGILLPNETLQDFPEDKVPSTKKTADGIFAQIRAMSGKSDDVPMDGAVPVSMPLPAVDEPHGERLAGFLKVVSEKPTSKGGIRFGLLIVPNLEDKEGGAWVNTFDTNLGELAKSLKGREVVCYYAESKYGKDLVDGGIVERQEMPN